MSRAFFVDVADALAGFLPPPLRSFSSSITSANLKVWYGEALREHYEVQFLSPRVVPGADGPLLEIGFHAEHRDPADSLRAVETLVERERDWRRVLGPRPEAGPFVGVDRWARLSELWTTQEMAGREVSVDAAERLAAYVTALEPLRRSRAVSAP
ncbi:MAG TPA: hypothetical protein VM840_11105 [Actinomycetota bacterium]|nr:hypothetical protein [Actinomycetota bacterium]